LAIFVRLDCVWHGNPLSAKSDLNWFGLVEHLEIEPSASYNESRGVVYGVVEKEEECAS